MGVMMRGLETTGARWLRAWVMIALVVVTSAPVIVAAEEEDGSGAAAASVEADAAKPAAEAARAEEPEEPAKKPATTEAPSIPDDATEAERAAFLEYQRAYARYKLESQDYESTVNDIVDTQYRQRVAEITSGYQRDIDNLSAVERQHRIDAIVAFERFTERYPNNEEYTPDALFRLAELYFEKANDDYLLADEEYQSTIFDYEAGRIPDPPAEPIRDYANTIRTFRRLINDWPAYRLNDGAFYLLAYCEQQMGNDDSARELFGELIKRHPESQFVPESYIRIGEYHFDLNQLDQASEAYESALKQESRFFDKALYKFAWTQYRMDNFDRAIEQFKRLIEYSDKEEARTGKSGSVLRAEAVQYAAISLSEEDWDLDGITDDEFGLTRAKQYLPGTKPYEREVLAQLGEYLFESERYFVATDILRYTLAQFPMNELNPELHEQLVLSLFRSDMMDEAFAERRNLGLFYGPGSEWYTFQEKEGNVEAMRFAQRLVRDNLIQSATWYHEQAGKTLDEANARDDEMLRAQARDRYSLAAETYAQFIRKNPNDKDFYQWTFYYAETLFYAQRYEEAFEQYKVVRELDIDGDEFRKVQNEAGFNAVKALEEVLTVKIATGEMPGYVLPGGTEQPPEPPKPEGDESTKVSYEARPMPGLLTDFVTSLDRYVVLGLTNEQDPNVDSKFAFQAAKLYYDYWDYPKARARFQWIIDNYPDQEVAAFAAALTIETYRQERDFASLAAAAEQFKGKLSEKTLAPIEAEIKEFELAGLFKAAEQAFAAKDYEQAVEKYLELVSRDVEKKYTSKALFNASVAYEFMNKFDSAMKLYEQVYRDYPDDPLSSYALYRVAVNAERFFEYDKAVTNYIAFYERFGKKVTPEELAGLDFDYDDRAQKSLLNAAVLLKDQQKYRKAAQRFEEFERTYPANENADDASWEAVLAWEKEGRKREMNKAIDAFISRHGSSENNLKVFQGLDKQLEYALERKAKKTERELYERMLSEYVARSIAPGTPEAYYAAKAQFMLTEVEFEKWDAIQIKGNVKKQGDALKAKLAGVPELDVQYDAVVVYENLEFVMAAFFRKGHMRQRFAQALYDATVPFPEGTDEWDFYRQRLDDYAIPLEDQAIEIYENIAKQARERKVVNEWTKRTLEELNKYRPAEYPLYKEERRATVESNSSGQPLLDAAGAKSATGDGPGASGK